jgi:hypothetical protein
LQAVACEFPFHRQRNQELFPHQPETCFLHSAGIVKEFDIDVGALSDPPRPPAGLPQGVNRVAGLVEKYVRKGPKV